MTPLLGDVLQVHGVEVATLFVVACILSLPTPKFLNIQFCFLLDPRLIGVRADDNILAINQLRPWVRTTASETVRCIATFAFNARGSITAVLLEGLLSKAWTSRTWGEVELLAPQLSDRIKD